MTWSYINESKQNHEDATFYFHENIRGRLNDI